MCKEDVIIIKRLLLPLSTNPIPLLSQKKKKWKKKEQEYYTHKNIGIVSGVNDEVTYITFINVLFLSLIDKLHMQDSFRVVSNELQ